MPAEASLPFPEHFAIGPYQEPDKSSPYPKATTFYDTYERYSSIYVAVRGSAGGLGTALQAGRSRIRFPMMSLQFFVYIILLAAYGPGVDSASN
jgi:hypothetical protein